MNSALNARQTAAAPGPWGGSAPVIRYAAFTDAKKVTGWTCPLLLRLQSRMYFSGVGPGEGCPKEGSEGKPEPLGRDGQGTIHVQRRRDDS